MTDTPLLDWKPRYPDSPGFKVSGTSEEAAEAIKPVVHYLQGEIIKVLGAYWPGGLTPDECAELLNESILSVRPRFSELKEKKLIVKSGERRKNKSGRAADVWRVR